MSLCTALACLSVCLSVCVSVCLCLCELCFVKYRLAIDVFIEDMSVNSEVVFFTDKIYFSSQSFRHKFAIFRLHILIVLSYALKFSRNQ